MNKLNAPHFVSNPKTGEIVTTFEGKDKKTYGRVRLDQVTTQIRNNMESDVRRTAFITLQESVLERRMNDGSLVEFGPYIVAGQEGKLLVQESTTPFYEGQDPKTAGKDGDVITHGGMPVYRNTIFSIDGNSSDELLVSDSVNATVSATAGVE